jgi:capsular polysaccharide export protein
MNITIFVIAPDKAKFFYRVANGWKQEHVIRFLTTRYSTYLYLKHNQCSVNMLQDFIKNKIDIDDFLKFKDEASLMERKANLLPSWMIDRQFIWLCTCFVNYFSQNIVNKFVIWNGSMLQGYIASKIADHFGISKLFFEIGNFPNKLFVDSHGVNAASSLTNKDLCECPNYCEEKLIKFLREHKQAQEGKHLVYQAKKSYELNYLAVLDSAYNLFSKYPILEYNYSLFYKWKKKKIINKFIQNYDHINLNNTKYIFFPLQMSQDSQILRNCNITIEESIDYALKDANLNNMYLVIKPHPAEKNKNIYAHIVNLKKNFANVLLTNINTYKLIKHAEKVITINSTVGIESLLYYKHVEVLGNAFYKKYCTPDVREKIDTDKVNRFLYNYFFNILKDGNLFSDETIYINKLICSTIGSYI